MKATIHQQQLRVYPGSDFTKWLEQHVGVFGEDWGRTYDTKIDLPGFGTTWWFKNPHHATLTLLRWA